MYYNLNQLHLELKNNNYIPGDYIKFKVYEPKERKISAPQFKDKIVQFAIHNIINNDFENKFIKDSYACQKNKGTHKCAKRINHYLSKTYWEYNNPWILKADMKDFFYSIDHKILKNILGKEIKCDKTLKLLYKIIDYSPSNPGLPLGNVTSQLFANIYLNELDKYCKRKLSLKTYSRYMDDIFVVLKNRNIAKKIKKLISNFVNAELNLKLNNDKSKVFPLEQGINIVGYKIHSTHMLLRNGSKKRIKQKLKKFPDLMENNELSIEKVEQILNSWKGHADYACSENFYKYLEERFNFVERENRKFIVK